MSFSWLGPYLLAVGSFLLALFLTSQLLTQRRAPSSTAAWLLLMIFLPHIGVPLFLLLGYRKIRVVQSKKKLLSSALPYSHNASAIGPLERILLASGATPERAGNELKFFDTPNSAYEGLLATLKSAMTSISITTFILKLDDVGKSILSVLEERARAGVEVRLLLDGLGSFSTFRFRLKQLIQSGGKLSYFLPMVHIPFFGHSNLRNHRKLVVVDRKIAICGGMNIAHEYMGPTLAGHWVDLAFKIKGPIVSDLEAVFNADWAFATNEHLPSASSIDEIRMVGNDILQVVPSGPDVTGDPLYDSLTLTIFSAKTRVWIATPYFIPDEILAKALELATKRGVDVRVLVPGKSNHVLADFCRRSYVRQLKQAGGQVLYYPEMLHAKAVIVDDEYCLVGSANLDMRSLLLNFELGLFVYSKTAVDEIARWFEQRFSQSKAGTMRESYFLDSLDGIGRILGPIL